MLVFTGLQFIAMSECMSYLKASQIDLDPSSPYLLINQRSCYLGWTAR